MYLQNFTQKVIKTCLSICPFLSKLFSSAFLRISKAYLLETSKDKSSTY
ncbi:hypothetical protein COPEUT_01478 [Coprococcus eutactus ATCC 27759]|nr:hypothetical protein COPEUT_01478 [Coprococcus eutactus ATCC 27759]